MVMDVIATSLATLCTIGMLIVLLGTSFLKRRPKAPVEPELDPEDEEMRRVVEAEAFLDFVEDVRESEDSHHADMLEHLRDFRREVELTGDPDLIARMTAIFNKFEQGFTLVNQAQGDLADIMATLTGSN